MSRKFVLAGCLSVIFVVGSLTTMGLLLAQTPVNQAPVVQAEACAPTSAEPHTGFVKLASATASDPDGDSLQHLWTVTTAPTGASYKVVFPTELQAGLCVWTPGDYQLTLETSDGSVTASDTVNVHFDPYPNPIATVTP